MSVRLIVAPPRRTESVTDHIGRVRIFVQRLPEQEITESAVAALGRALELKLSTEDLASLAAGLHATRREMASLDSFDLDGVEPAIRFQPRPPADPR